MSPRRLPPGVRQLPSGLYQATVRLPNGKRATRTDSLMRVVVAWRDEERARLARGQWRDPRAGRITVGEWHDQWWAARVVEPETRRGDESTLRLHILPHWRTWQLAAVTRIDVQAWVRRMEQDGVGSSAIRRAYQLLSTMLGAAVLEGLLADTPCRKIDLPATPPKAPAWFTREQVDAVETALLDGLPDGRRKAGNTSYPRHATAVELMVWTGLRWGEMAGLRIGDVDWMRQRIKVVGARTQAGAWKEYPKTSKSRREVPVPRPVLDALSVLVDGRGDDAPLFVTERGTRPWSASNWRKVWDAAVEVAGVPAFSPHSCRHTAASWLVQDGVPLYDVQRLLGHESFQTTLKYAHLAPGHYAAVEASWERRLVAHQKRMAGE